MKLSRLLFAEMTREDLRAAARDALVVLPLGATEQHGPHLPVGTDYFTVEHVARAAGALAAEEIPLLVAPALPFGCSQHHIPFGGTFSLTTETYYQAVRDLSLAVIRSGFSHLFLLNGHGGNHELAQLVARDLALEYPAHIAAASYWNIAWDALVAEQAHIAMGLPGHAGIFETSVMLALREELVARDRPHRDDVPDSDPRGFAKPYRAEFHGWWQSINGFTDSPDRATAERGHRYTRAINQAVAQALVEFYRACEATP